MDLAVLDLELPDIPGFRLIELLRGEAPGIRIVVNTVHEEIWTLRQLEQSSVDGIVFKSVNSSQLVQTVRRVLEASEQRHSGQQPQTAPGQRQPSQTASGSKTGTGCSPLSPKELEVLQLVADGKDSREIASILYITENTVESHRSHIMRKLGATNAADMVMKAITLGLIPPSFLHSLIRSTFRRWAVSLHFLLTFRRCADEAPLRGTTVAAFPHPPYLSHLPKVRTFLTFSTHLPKVGKRGTL